jgi:integrase
MGLLTIMLTKSVPYTFTRNGYFYFSRRVPTDLRHIYSEDRIVEGLRTKCAKQAKLQSQQASAKLEAYWASLRVAHSVIPGAKHVLGGPIPKAYSPAPTVQSDQPDLIQALQLYLDLKGKNRPKSFEAAATRTCNYVIDIAGNKPLGNYSRSDALRFRDWLVDRGLSGSSVTRNFSYIKAVFNFAVSEYALDLKNPFIGVYHDRSSGVIKRKPIPISDLLIIQAECRNIDDDLRWLIALLSDTGMRLAEGAGLLKSDIHLDAKRPFVRIQKHPWRNLKTNASERDVPLVGASLWATQRLLEADNDTAFAFQRYNQTSTTAANSASAALNKWMKAYVPQGCTLHSFRHSMRDRLRAVQCPADIIDQIGGWATEGVGQNYGNGHKLDVTHAWLRKAIQHNGQ